MKRFNLKAFLFLSMLIALPLTGLLFTGSSISTYLEIPPRTVYARHAPFDLRVFIFGSVFVTSFLLPFMYRLIWYNINVLKHYRADSFKFPWWGYAGLLLCLISWLLAWNRFLWFAVFQQYTFFPIWLGYILTVNGLTLKRSRYCMMLSKPRYFISLFALSAIFWWIFEYLNRFVQNWHYIGIEDFTTCGYFLNATLCFSTVLPSVVSTRDFLNTFPWVVFPFRQWKIYNIKRKHLSGWIAIIVASIGLAGIGVSPDYLFPVLWVSPLLLIIGLQTIRDEHTIFRLIRYGDWSEVFLFSSSAVICGFFWELWNYHSYAHWVYSVPYVQHFSLFEMPLLGYAGYLPFGLECAIAAGLIKS